MYPKNLLILEYVLKIRISEISASCNILIKYILVLKKSVLWRILQITTSGCEGLLREKRISSSWFVMKINRSRESWATCLPRNKWKRSPVKSCWTKSITSYEEVLKSWIITKHHFFLIFPTLFSFIAFSVNFSTSGKTWNIFFSFSLDSQQSSRSLRYCHSSVPAGQKERGLRLDRRRQQCWVQDLLAWTDKF